MKLDEFISEALVGIAKGIISAQESYQEFGTMGGQVNPIDLKYLHPDVTAVQHEKTSRIGQIVDFDLTVTGSEKVGASGKAGIEVLSVGLSGKVEGATEQGHVNKIKFKIPVIFPKCEYEEESKMVYEEDGEE